MIPVCYRGLARPDGEVWVYGSLIVESLGSIKIRPDRKSSTDRISETHVFGHTVGLYTGKKDKDGTMIFSDDIVEYNFQFPCGSENFEPEASVFGVVSYIDITNDYGQGVGFFAEGVELSDQDCLLVRGNIHQNNLEEVKNAIRGS